MPVDKYLSILRQYWGYEDFRGIQRSIIESIGSHKDTLGLMPTGGGKSITFQVPALAEEGVCIVITPLISLMKDQVTALRKLNIRAAAIYSGQSHQEILEILENCVFGAYKIVYISPERISSDIFQTKLRRINVSFFTVDEAHCISQWGYDFRPSYLQITEIRKLKPGVPVLALTATATHEVVKDIQEKLLFKEENVFRMSFARKNLAYIVRHADNQKLEMYKLLKAIPGSCIIYTRNRIYSQELAEQLCKEGFSATFYHAGIHDYLKDERQNQWQDDKIRIMVATNAFGMGIDKPNVRLVIHMDLPDSLEAYFQEAGRAGRDGKQAYAVIILDGKELDLSRRRISQTYPKIDYIQNVYEKVCFYLQMAIGDGQNVTREFNIEQFCRNFNFHPLMTKNALSLLDKAGYLDYRDSEDGTSRIRIKATRNDLYKVIDKQKEIIVNCMMRHYGGIFVDFVYLDEELVSKETNIPRRIIYQELSEMNKWGIVDYIPKKKIPHITFKRKRVEASHIFLPDSVYKTRKKEYTQRLKAMQEYCLSEDTCRSRILLTYFDEKSYEDCGQCDVCKKRKAYEISDEEFQEIKSHLIKQLENGPIRPDKLDIIGINPDKLHWVLEYMRGHEEIRQEEDLIRLVN